MNRTVLLIMLVALIGAGAGFLIGQRVQGPSPWRTAPGADVPAPMRELPPLRLPQVDGTPRSLAEFRGRPLLINYWATWCPPCIKEMPVLDAFATEQGAKGVAVVGIALDEPDAVRQFLQRVPVAYPNLIEAPGAGDSSVALGNSRNVLPFSVLADAQGRVLAVRAGSFDAAQLRRWVADNEAASD